MSTFTPGPWEACITQSFWWPGVDAEGQSLIIMADLGSESGIHGASREEAQANARLIAASPDLFAYVQKRYDLLCHKEAEFDASDSGRVPQALTDEIFELRTLVEKVEPIGEIK